MKDGRVDRDRMQEALAAEADFCNYTGSLGVHHCNWFVHGGDPGPALQHLGHWHDLLVLGRGDASPWESDHALADLMMASRLPCMVIPGRPDLAPLRPHRIAVAWDGSLHAVRALHAAVPLLEQAQEVFLLTGGRSGDVHRETGLPDFDLKRYCESHGLRTVRVPLEPSQDQTGLVLRVASVKVEADLLVMGAFGHSRLRERMFGGVTRYLLQHSSIPLLLRH
jgi:nucleotide-binding universal stress UspA family protein